jgi:hypothetical protein
MKTNIIRIAAAFTLSVATLVNPMYAADKDPAKKAAKPAGISWASILPYKQDKKVAISFQAIDSDQPAKIQIFNDNNEVVYQEYVKHPHIFQKVYDLKKLDEGIYTLKITTNGSETQKTFALGQILFTDALRVIFLAGSDYQHFRIGVENLAKGNIQYQVKDSAGKVVQMETMKNVYKEVIEKDFSSLASGEYTVEMSSDNENFTKKLLIP